MGLVAKDNGGGGFNRQLPTPGLHHAVCSKAFDLGLQAESYNGESSTRHKALVVWEIDELIDDENSEYNGKRLLVHREYTLSLTEKSRLREHLESWRGKEFSDKELADGFDITKLLGVQCQLMVMTKTSKAGNQYAVVQSVAPAGKTPPLMNPELPDDWCPEWIKKKIAEGVGAVGDVADQTFDDDVPF